jgi:hypothetical protein
MSLKTYTFLPMRSRREGGRIEGPTDGGDFIANYKTVVTAALGDMNFCSGPRWSYRHWVDGGQRGSLTIVRETGSSEESHAFGSSFFPKVGGARHVPCSILQPSFYPVRHTLPL